MTSETVETLKKLINNNGNCRFIDCPACILTNQKITNWNNCPLDTDSIIKKLMNY
jgi:hypothetical protein